MTNVTCLIPKGEEINWNLFSYWGISNLGEAHEDARFYNALLPEGWSVKKGNEDSGFSSSILDKNNHKRVTIDPAYHNEAVNMHIAKRRYIVRIDIPLTVNVYDMAEFRVVEDSFPKAQYAKNVGKALWWTYENLGVVYEGNFYYSARNRVFESKDSITNVPDLRLMSEEEWASARRGSWNFDAYGDVDLAIGSIIKPPAMLVADALEGESGWGIPSDFLAVRQKLDGR